MEKLNAAYIASLCEGTLIGEDVLISGIVRDNREINGGELFVAISGERFDGHDFAADAKEISGFNSVSVFTAWGLDGTGPCSASDRTGKTERSGKDGKYDQ